MVGEILGFCAGRETALKGGARTDPVGMRIELTGAALKKLAERQRDELSPDNYNKRIQQATAAAKSNKRVTASHVGLGGIPPSLETLAGVACHRIVRSHVLSFAALRQIRFGAGPDGDAAWRALLAALALAALARLRCPRIRPQPGQNPIARASIRPRAFKEQLREAFAAKGGAGRALLAGWISWARRSRLPEFVKLAKTITCYRNLIHNTLDHRMSNALSEATNTHIRLLIQRAYGYHSPDALIAMASLTRGGLCSPLPGRS